MSYVDPKSESQRILTVNRLKRLYSQGKERAIHESHVVLALYELVI